MDHATPTAELSRIDIWIMAIRPKILPAALAPVVVGLAFAVAAERGSWFIAAVTVIVSMLLQIISNFVNDLGDFRRGADAERLGPPRVTQMGLLTEAEMKRGIGVVIGLATLLGSILIAHGGWPIAILGVASVLAAIAYTGGPFPLAYHGLGEVAVAFFFGGVGVLGTVFLQLGELPSTAWVAAAVVACHASAILVVNNLRDLSNDAAVGKRTLAVRLGESGTVIEYTLQILIPFAFVAAVAFTALERIGWLLPLVLLPIAWNLVRGVAQTRGRGLNRYLGATARFGLHMALLLAGGIALERWL